MSEYVCTYNSLKGSSGVFSFYCRCLYILNYNSLPGHAYCVHALNYIPGGEGGGPRSRLPRHAHLSVETYRN